MVRYFCCTCPQLQRLNDELINGYLSVISNLYENTTVKVWFLGIGFKLEGLVANTLQQERLYSAKHSCKQSTFESGLSKTQILKMWAPTLVTDVAILGLVFFGPTIVAAVAPEAAKALAITPLSFALGTYAGIISGVAVHAVETW
jgi:hypothetical protein